MVVLRTLWCLGFNADTIPAHTLPYGMFVGDTLPVTQAPGTAYRPAHCPQVLTEQVREALPGFSYHILRLGMLYIILKNNGF